MSASLKIVLALLACACGGAGAACIAVLRGKRIQRVRRHEAALRAHGAVADAAEKQERKSWVLRYAEQLTRRLFTGAAMPLSPSVRAHRAGKTRSGKRYLAQATAAGCNKEISVSAFCETQLRLSIAGALAGALLGVVLSTELSILLGVAGALLGRALPGRAVASLKKKRSVCAERHLSEMLEVVALGLRSGLTFDRAFALYGSHFDNEFAVACERAYRKWSLGLTTREEALHELAASFDCNQLARIVDLVVRGLRFGASITDALEDAAAQSRATYRAALEERVAKAPVKMMLPTGTLILPAMLLLVMGPILLELAGGF